MKYGDIEDAFLCVSAAGLYENTVYLDRRTGHMYFVSEFGDSDELPNDIDDGDKYITIPHKYDLDLEKEMVFDFVMSHMPDDLDAVYSIFDRKGAYSRFKRFLENRNMLQVWYDYENQRTESALRQWCRDNDIKLDN